MKELIVSNVIIVADKFNPSLFSQIWLDKHGILPEQESKGDQINTPVFVLAQSELFSLQVWPERLQFSYKAAAEDATELIRNRVGRIVELLPHTPFTAAGMNFTWHVSMEDSLSFPAVDKSMFWRDSSLHSLFDTKDARFGGYFSKNFLGTRLRLDIKPVNKNGLEFFQAAFNFHVDLAKGDPVELILRNLQDWEALKKHSEQISDVIDAFVSEET